MIKHFLSFSLLLALLPGCHSSTGSGPPGSASPGAGSASQLASASPKVPDAYSVAGRVELPSISPQDFPELHNVFVLSETIISGSEPRGAEGFAKLKAMGVKTILSVDGKVPAVKLAAEYGMRYVHLPIRYKGIEDGELMRMAKAFRELEAPFYIHCFHGKHRGPAAAAVGRIVLDGADRERALAEMRQWCGTSEQYAGLYEVIAAKPIPNASQSAAFDWDFPSARPMEGLRQAMVEIPRLHDNIELLADMNWQLDPQHPDIAPLNEAQTLLQVFQDLSQTEEVTRRPEKFQRLMTESVEQSEALVKAIENGNNDAAMQAFEALQERCSSCHRTYRNQR